MDARSRCQRSENMSRIKGKDTAPEWVVRRIVFALGHRYRLHVRSLPGRPDLVFPGRHKVIFVHGCFWHGHAGCKRATIPATNTAFWASKINGNKRRDRYVKKRLRSQGWDILDIWQCQLRDHDAVRRRLRKFLAQLATAGPIPRAEPSRLRDRHRRG